MSDPKSMTLLDQTRRCTQTNAGRLEALGLDPTMTVAELARRLAIAERALSIHPQPGDSKGVFWSVDAEAFPDETWYAQPLLTYIIEGSE